MKGIRKPYVKNPLEPHARRAFIKFFKERNNIELIENPDQFGIDLVSKRFSVELEGRNCWRGGDFRYDTVSLLERKKEKDYLKSPVPGFFVAYNNKSFEPPFQDCEMLITPLIILRKYINAKLVETDAYNVPKDVEAPELRVEVPLNEWKKLVMKKEIIERTKNGS